MNFLQNAWSEATGVLGQYLAGRNNASSLSRQSEQFQATQSANLSAAQLRAKQIQSLALIGAVTVVAALAIRKAR